MKIAILTFAAAALALSQAATARQLFDAQLQAKRRGNTLEITETITNRSNHNACFAYLGSPPYELHHRNGPVELRVATWPEMDLSNGQPSPEPIQFVLNGGEPIHYHLADIKDVAADVVSVDTNVKLTDCRDLARDWNGKQRTDFKADIQAAISD